MDRRRRLARERKERKRQAELRLKAQQKAEENPGPIVSSKEELKQEREKNKREQKERAEAQKNDDSGVKGGGATATPALERTQTGLADDAATESEGEGDGDNANADGKAEDSPVPHPVDGLVGKENQGGDEDEDDVYDAAAERKALRIQRHQSTANEPLAATWFGRLWQRFRKRRQDAKAFFYHYGPPYEEDYGGNLPKEIGGNMSISWYEVHSMLNEGADPRIGDPEDYSNTPMHYACRFCRMDIAKALRQAGSGVNQQNEVGVTPLAMACMFNQPEQRRKQHTKLVKWLLDEGADANCLDRGGHTPVEHAAFFGNMEVVSLLIQNGAKIIRPTKYLSMRTPSALDVVWKEDVKHIISMCAGIEEKELQERREEHRRRLQERLEEEQWNKKMAERRKEKMEALKEARRLREIALKEREMKEQERIQQKNEQVARLEKATAAKEAHTGVWRKKAKMRWDYHPGEIDLATKERNMNEEAQGIAIENQTRTTNKRVKRRWKKFTKKRLVKPCSQEEFLSIMSPTYRPPKPRTKHKKTTGKGRLFPSSPNEDEPGASRRRKQSSAMQATLTATSDKENTRTNQRARRRASKASAKKA